MVAEAKRTDVEHLAKLSQCEIDNLHEYINLLKGIVDTLEQDIVTMRRKAKTFLKNGQKENYEHAMEKIDETLLRIETCQSCLDDCNRDIERKSERMKEYDHFLKSE
jgi:phage shock protein A